MCVYFFACSISLYGVCTVGSVCAHILYFRPKSIKHFNSFLWWIDTRNKKWTASKKHTTTPPFYTHYSPFAVTIDIRKKKIRTHNFFLLLFFFVVANFPLSSLFKIRFYFVVQKLHFSHCALSSYATNFCWWCAECKKNVFSPNIY